MQGKFQMKTFIKTLVAGVIATVSLHAQSASNGVGGYWVNNIVPNSQAVQNTLKQSSTGYTKSCGPTTLLFIHNHLSGQPGGFANFNIVAGSQAAVDSIYGYLGIPLNSYTSINQMKAVAKGKFGYTNSVRMPATNTLIQNMDKLIDYMNRDIPVITVLRGGYGKNPVGNYDHIAFIFAYNRMKDEYGRNPLDPLNTRNNDTISWYEPYYGTIGQTLRKEVTSSGSSSAFNIVNFSFVAIAK